MTINFYNFSCFKLQSGDTSLVFDPPSKESGVKFPRFSTDLVLISHNHKPHNGRDAVKLKDENSDYIIDSPGEYEIKNISIKGISSFHDSEGGKTHGLNTIFIIEMDDLRICHLGDYGEDELRPDIKEELGSIDILFIPINAVADDKVVSLKSAKHLINEIEPSLVVPMHYDAGDKKNKSLAEFLSEFSEESAERLDKLVIKKKDINSEKTKIIVLESSL